MPTLILATTLIAQAQVAADGGWLTTVLTAFGGLLTTLGGIGGTMAWQRRRQAPEPQAMEDEHSHPGHHGCGNTDAIRTNTEAVGAVTHTLDRVTDVLARIREDQGESKSKLDEINIRLVELAADFKAKAKAG